MWTMLISHVMQTMLIRDHIDKSCDVDHVESHVMRTMLIWTVLISHVIWTM